MPGHALKPRSVPAGMVIRRRGGSRGGGASSAIKYYNKRSATKPAALPFPAHVFLAENFNGLNNDLT